MSKTGLYAKTFLNKGFNDYIIMSLLKEIDDDHDFVCGAMSNAATEEAWQKLIDFIQTAKQQGDPVSADDILALSLVLSDNAGIQATA